MFTYDEAKHYLVEHLSRDVALHSAGDYWRVGDNFDEFDKNLPRNDDPKFRKLHIALNFWDGWQDSRDHDWHFYKGISQTDWPRLAEIIIQNVKEEKEITDEIILEHFDLRPREGMISKLKKVFKTKTNP
jgi:hypothetical protein